jgi:hypothetical protein
MPSLSDDAYNNLKKQVADVSFRAGRLREWIALGRSLRNLDGSFRFFVTDSRGLMSIPPSSNLPRISDSWRNIEDNPLVELEGYRAPNGVRYINRALIPNGSGPDDPTVIQWLDHLLELGGQIRGAIDAMRIQELGDARDKFDAHLRRVIGKQKATVDGETEQLFMIATILNSRLDS